MIDYSLNGQLDEVNACSFKDFVRGWTSGRLSNIECRDNSRGQTTDIFFQVECEDSLGF